MSTNSPAVSKRPSMSRRFRPLSMTCVRPLLRGFGSRAGISSHDPLEAGIKLLQLLLRALLDVVVERVAVGVDADGQRPEVLDTELPQALRHQVLPGDLLDLLDLRRLQRRCPADDGEIHHPVLAQRLDRLVREAPLAADRADAVLAAERLREAHHAGARRRPDRERLVPDIALGIWAHLADVRRGMEQERAVQVDRRLLALVEDPDLGPVADPDDVALDDDLVAGAELQDLLVVRYGERHLMR